MINIKKISNKNEIKILTYIVLTIFFGTILSVSYAFFNYTRTGEAVLTESGVIYFSSNNGSSIDLGNAFALSTSDIDTTMSKTFTLSSHTTYQKGVKYRVYATLGDDVSGKNRLLNDAVTVEFIPPADGNGFTTEVNNYSTPKSLIFVDNKALISTGLIQNTSQLTTKSYTIKLWIDSSKINVSSTTKRANNNEGYPSLADTTIGTTTATRYMRNNSSELTTVTLYPANDNQEGKIIYTTDEFENSYYSIKILIEAEDNTNRPLVYLDADGGSLGNNSNTLQVNLGQNYPTLPTPTRAGYTFLGWTNEVLLSKNYWEQGGMVDASGMVNTSVLTTRIRTKDYYSVSPSTQYTITSSDTTTINPVVIRFVYLYNDSKGFINTNDSINKSKIVFTTPSNGSYIKIVLQYLDGSTSIPISVLDNTDIVLSELINNTVIVTQNKDHVLKAIWQNNN